MKKKLQRPFQVKEMDTVTGVFSGYGSVFGELDSYRDIVMPGAFKSTLQRYKENGRKVPMLWQHRAAEPIGVYTDIKEDDTGLLVIGEINMNVVRGAECAHLMKQGALSGLSIGYNTIRDDYDEKKFINRLHEVELWEVSPVTFPAGDSARVDSIKSLPDLASLSDAEDWLREQFEVSQKEATAIVSRFKSIILNPSDSGNTKGVGELLEALQGVKF